MPRYFFNVHDGEAQADARGTELADRDEARRQAVVTAGEMLRETGQKLCTPTFGKCTSPMSLVIPFAG